MSGEKQSRLYKELAEQYRDKNINQAWLCYENALYHYQKECVTEVSDIDKETGLRSEQMDPFCRECSNAMRALENQPGFVVAKTAVILLSYNHGELTQACIESLRQNNSPKTYELMVVDNASTDGIVQWLRQQKDIRLIENQENQGFPYGCNQGIALAREESNILLLNNDTIVPPNAIFWLRMGLYEKEQIGAVGSVSNNVVNYQQVPQHFETVKEWLEFAEDNNVPMKYPYEKKSWLVGFAMLIRRTALRQVLAKEQAVSETVLPEILDTRFSPGNFEDNDLSIRLLLAGYQLRLVKNSFIFHYGSKAFQRAPEQFLNLLQINQKKLAEKYGMDLIPNSAVETALVNMITSRETSLRVLEIGCKLGATLARIESRFPSAEVLGIEKNEFLARLASGVTNVVQGDFLEMVTEELCQNCKVDSLDEASQLNKSFDYILMDKVLTDQAKQFLEKAKVCLSANGKILIVVYNAQCIRSVRSDVEKGFTLDELTELCNACKLQILRFNYQSAQLSKAEKQKIVELCGSWDHPMRLLYEAEKFIFETAV